MHRHLRRLQKILKRRNLRGTALDNGAVLLEGSVDRWEDKLEAGFLAAKFPFRGVVNRIVVKGVDETPPQMPKTHDHLLEGKSFDVVVIGGGVIGCSVARELSRWKLSIAVLEKLEDVGLQASSRNDGMIHPGMAPSPGTQKAFFNARGNRMYTRIAEELGFELQRPGSILLFKKRWYRWLVPFLKNRCRKNGVDGHFRGLSRKEVLELEPAATGRHFGGFFMPSAGIVSPMQVTIAYAENAAENGVKFYFETAVTGFEKQKDRVTTVHTNRGGIQARLVINAAGVWADRIAEEAGDGFFTIHGRKGTDAILDKKTGPLQKRILGEPELIGRGHSKGGGIVPCIEGNLLVGPNAVEVPNREDYSTDREDFEELLKRLRVNPALSRSMIINYYSGIRAATWKEDFIVETSTSVPNLIHLAGIQSPGLASAPAIAEYGAGLASEILYRGKPELNPDFDPHRKRPREMARLSEEERAKRLARNPAYGHIICRCEGISEGEIRDALRSPLPATTTDGIKRRIRAGAGRCHGGFCLPKILEIIADEKGITPEEICKKGPGSFIVLGDNRTEARS